MILIERNLSSFCWILAKNYSKGVCLIDNFCDLCNTLCITDEFLIPMTSTMYKIVYLLRPFLSQWGSNDTKHLLSNNK